MAPTSSSQGMTMKRINREIKDLQKEDLGGMTLEPVESNVFLWRASMPGPEGSPYEGGVFNLNIELGSDYPFSAPKVTFITRIYHMNISERGNICIDVLKQNWSPALSLYKVLLSLSSLLTDANPKDPLVPSIANEYVRNRRKHDDTARDWTRLYARPPEPKRLQADATSGAKEKGKVSASPVSQSRNEGNGQSRRSALHQRVLPAISSREIIDICDVDETSGNGRRTGARTRASAKRKRGSELDIDEGRDAGGSSRRRRHGGPADEVIIIED